MGPLVSSLQPLVFECLQEARLASSLCTSLHTTLRKGGVYTTFCALESRWLWILFLLNAHWTNVNTLFSEIPTLLQKFDITLPGVNDRHGVQLMGGDDSPCDEIHRQLLTS